MRLTRQRTASTTPTALAKRPRPSSSSSSSPISLEGSLSEELLLRCLSFLSASDLSTVSRVSHAWHRLSLDPHLWRALYLRHFASPSTRRLAASGAQVKRTRPWRELYKVSSNWRSGNAQASELGRGIRRAVLPEAPAEMRIDSVADRGAAEGSTSARGRSGATGASSPDQDVDTLLQFHHHTFFTASRTSVPSPSEAPLVTVHQSLPGGASTVLGSFSSPALRAFYVARPDFRPPMGVTEMRLDEDPSPEEGEVRLAVFYSTGQFSLFRVTLPSASSSSSSLPATFSATELHAHLSLASPLSFPFTTSLRSSQSTPFDPVRLARLRGPLLVTCSEALTVRFWRLHATPGAGAGEGTVDVEEAETPLQANERSWRPVVLSLAEVGTEAGVDGREGLRGRRGRFGWEDAEGEEEEKRYRVTLAYSTPVFPASWTVGLQEFLVTLPPSSPSPSRSRSHHPKLHITLRHALARPLHAPLPSTPRRVAPFSSSPSPFSAPHTPPPTRPACPVTALEHAHPFVVASRADNQLDVYEVVAFSSSPPPLRPPHYRTSVPTAADLASPLRPRSSPLQAPRAPQHQLQPQPQLRLEHRRTLFGHTARVGGVALVPLSSSSTSSSSPSRATARRDTESAGVAAVRCVSAGDDGQVKVWELRPTPISSPAAPLFAGEQQEEEEEEEERPAKRARRERQREGAVDIRAHSEAAADEDGAEETTAWHRLRSLRASRNLSRAAEGDRERPARVSRVWVGEDKIVVVSPAVEGRGAEEGEGETVRVLRFD
ncbi:hypothetical protein JCM10207_007750 [Rhodosporidiobolus poonsookiae]